MNQEQKLAFKLVKDGKNVFITGPGGTGKSYTLLEIVNWARNSGIEIAITASTGCAAYLIRGRTLHSYLGIGLAKKTPKELAEFIMYKRPFIATKLRALKILIIDEVSMISDTLLSKISEFLSIIRRSPKPFGNLQLVLCGDFCQLPNIEDDYCFKSDEWTRANITMVELTKMMRQIKDLDFRKILAELRFGNCTIEAYKMLKDTKHNNIHKNGILPTILYSMNIDVDKINIAKFNELIQNGAVKQSYKTTASQSGKNWATSIKIPETIDLCIGAQVVLTWNIAQDDGLINGSRGVITRFAPTGLYVRFVDGEERLIESIKINQEDDESTWIKFVPLKLAFALTVHKSQGMTLDAAILDLGESIFEFGQAYTALSRVRDLKSVKIVSLKRSSFKVAESVKDFYQKK